ncbi:hypothetical protein C8F01DRAFT_1083334 [Mycena amicta]|nr:hypothetical protein C8F01DRAFT_1083334 [Mycena amicta]
MGRTALHLTQADQKRAARERVVKYNNSERGHAARSAQRRQRHARKVTGSVLGNVSLVPALLRQHASFELPVDDPGFLDGYSPDYNSLDGRFSPWARFPVFPPPPPDVDIHPDSAEYHEETRLIEAVLHGDYRKQEQVYELELGREADMAPKLRLQWLREEYEGALQSWRFWLSSLGKHKSERENTIFMLHLGWKARRALRLYHGIAQREEYTPLPGKVQTPRAATTILARRAASARYRERNKEQLRVKARERMASGKPPRANPLPRKHVVRRESGLAPTEYGMGVRSLHANGMLAPAALYNDTGWTCGWLGKNERRVREEQIEGDEALRLWHEAWAEQQQVKQRRREAAQALLCVSRS